MAHTCQVKPIRKSSTAEDTSCMWHVAPHSTGAFLLPTTIRKGASMRGLFFLLAHILSGVVFVSCSINLRSVLEDAVERLASDHQASLDRSKLANGVCFAPEDGGPGSGCEDPGKLRHEGRIRMPTVFVERVHQKFICNASSNARCRPAPSSQHR